ncbi:MAG: GyrI-like domain-containing protein [Thermoplasmata archaeon]
MVVDFAFKRVPEYRLATFAWTGPWSDARIRREFEKVAAWAARKGARTGKWVFLEPSERKFVVGIEVKGKVRGDGPIHLKTLPATRVASVVYDPKVIAPGVVYHGLADWLRWRRKDGDIKGSGQYREVYRGNPWTDPTAWAHTDVQIVVR